MRAGQVLALGLGLVLTAPVAAMAGCAADPRPCDTGSGTYHIVLPDGAIGDRPAVMFLHGWGGSGQGTLSNAGMVASVLARGYAVIAPDGLPREQGNGRTWDFHPEDTARRDEAGFLDAVADDAAARFDLQRDRILLAGFSIGGSMVSYVACAEPGLFAAYAPVAGTFWRAHPANCAGPVRLHHTHGWADTTFPLEGRALGPGFVQGNAFEAMAIWRAANACPLPQPDGNRQDGAFRLRWWVKGCAGGSALEFVLHDGSHGVPPGWADLVLNWFEPG